MRPGGKPKDENAGTHIAKAGNGTRPVGLVLIGTASGFADSAAIVTKTRTSVTSDDRIANLLKKWRKRLNVEASHCIP